MTDKAMTATKVDGTAQEVAERIAGMEFLAWVCVRQVLELHALLVGSGAIVSGGVSPNEDKREVVRKTLREGLGRVASILSSILSGESVSPYTRLRAGQIAEVLLRLCYVYGFCTEEESNEEMTQLLSALALRGGEAMDIAGFLLAEASFSDLCPAPPCPSLEEWLLGFPSPDATLYLVFRWLLGVVVAGDGEDEDVRTLRIDHLLEIAHKLARLIWGAQWGAQRRTNPLRSNASSLVYASILALGERLMPSEGLGQTIARGVTARDITGAKTDRTLPQRVRLTLAGIHDRIRDAARIGRQGVAGDVSLPEYERWAWSVRNGEWANNWSSLYVIGDLLAAGVLEVSSVEVSNADVRGSNEVTEATDKALWRRLITAVTKAMKLAEVRLNEEANTLRHYARVESKASLAEKDALTPIFSIAMPGEIVSALDLGLVLLALREDTLNSLAPYAAEMLRTGLQFIATSLQEIIDEAAREFVMNAHFEEDDACDDNARDSSAEDGEEPRPHPEDPTLLSAYSFKAYPIAVMEYGIWYPMAFAVYARLLHRFVVEPIAH